MSNVVRVEEPLDFWSSGKPWRAMQTCVFPHQREGADPPWRPATKLNSSQLLGFTTNSSLSSKMETREKGTPLTLSYHFRWFSDISHKAHFFIKRIKGHFYVWYHSCIIAKHDAIPHVQNVQVKIPKINALLLQCLLSECIPRLHVSSSFQGLPVRKVPICHNFQWES